MASAQRWTPAALLADTRARLTRAADALADGDVDFAARILFDLLDDLEAIERRLKWT